MDYYEMFIERLRIRTLDEYEQSKVVFSNFHNQIASAEVCSFTYRGLDAFTKKELAEWLKLSIQ